MELKSGYKQTEAGVIPEDWDALPAAQIGRFRGGTGFPLSYQGLQEGAFPFYKVSDMNNDGNEKFMVAANNWVSEETRRKLGAHAFPAGSIVFAKVGAAVFLERKKILSRPSCLDNNVAAFVLDEGRAWVPFIHAQLLDRKFGDLVATTALPSLSGKVLGEMVLALPPLDEQSAIATALDDMDALLMAQDALIAKRHAIKQGAMQELLTGKRRLPGFGGEWEAKRLGDFGVCHRGVGYDPNTDLFSGDAAESVRLLRANNVQEATVVLDGLQFVWNGRVSEHQYLRSGDVLICMANGSKELVGKAAQFSLNDGHEYTFGAFMGCYRPNQAEIDPTFAFYLFQTELYRRHLTTLLAGSSINNLSPKSIEGLEIKLPILREEQTAIAEALGDMDAEIAALEVKRDKIARLKQGMMQELLTGRTRLI